MEYFSIDYVEMDQTVQNLFPEKSLPSFSEVLKLLFSGTMDLPEVIKELYKAGKDNLFYGYNGTKELLMIACAASVLFLLLKLKKQGQAAETGFYVTYLAMMSGVISIFLVSRAIVSSALERLLSLMTAFLPVFSAGVVFSNGSLSATAVGQTTYLAIFLTGNIFQKLILPVISIYFLMSVMSRILFEDILSRFTGLFFSAANTGMRIIVGFVAGIGALRGMLAPAADVVKRSAFLKTAGAIPAVGDVFDGAASTVLSAGVLLKNAIGAAGVFFLFFVSCFPFLQVLIATVSLSFCAALLQPFSDKRLTDCIFFAAQSHKLLLRLLLYVFLMFLFLILLLAFSTSKFGG